jgi:GNAT superfamily N-acetyltransferase
MAMVRELAEFEREPEAVRTNEDVLLRDGFGPAPLFHCMLAEVPRRVYDDWCARHGTAEAAAGGGTLDSGVAAVPASRSSAPCSVDAARIAPSHMTATPQASSAPAALSGLPAAMLLLDVPAISSWGDAVLAEFPSPGMSGAAAAAAGRRGDGEGGAASDSAAGESGHEEAAAGAAKPALPVGASTVGLPAAHTARPAAGPTAASPDWVPIAMALAHPSYSTWEGRTLYLEDLYVKPAFRRGGVSGLLFTALARAAHVARCARLQWSVLTWNTPAISAYAGPKIAATLLDDWRLYRLYRDGVERLSAMPLLPPTDVYGKE